MHMRFALAAIALTLVTLVPAAAPAQSWEEYRPAGIGFRIEMPGKPKLETQKTKAGNTAYHAVATYRDMAFLTIYGDTYQKKSDDREALLETVVNSFTEGKKVLSSKKEMIGGYPARRVVLEDGQGQVRSQDRDRGRPPDPGDLQTEQTWPASSYRAG
jgi:hypothetical protein